VDGDEGWRGGGGKPRAEGCYPMDGCVLEGVEYLGTHRI
jgi:hypothetical protein